MVAEFIFYISILYIAYTVFGYPVFLIVSSIVLKKDITRKTIFPKVTIIIPVYNEENLIAEKINNCFQIDYPAEKLKIIVVSDCSTDGTERIVKSYKSERITFLELPFRGGKVSAQNYAVQFCDSPLIIFTDVAIRTDPDCIRLIAKNFNDDNIGAVSCRDAIVDTGDRMDGEKNYIQYDMLVRKYTSKIGTLIGVTGGFYGVRSSIAKGGWNPAFPPDFYVALRCIKKGYRVVEDPRVNAYYKTTPKGSDEMKRKIRTINRGMRALFSPSNFVLVNPIRYGIASFELISHKLMRWFAPFFLILLFISNCYMFNQSVITKILMICQLLLYSIGLYAFFFQRKLKTNNFFKIPLFFIIANLSILIALFEWMIGKKYIMWQPTKR